MPTAITNWGDAMMTSLAGAMAMFFAAIPKLLGFAVIVVVGWFIASLVEKGLRSMLRAVKFNQLADRAGLSEFVAKTGQKADASQMMALIAKWFIRLIVLVVAFDALGLPAVSEVLNSLLMWLPNLAVALAVLLIGGLAATALSNIVRGAAAEAEFDRPDIVAKVAKIAVWAFAIVVAVNQIGIATELVNTLFMASVGALALALGLSFGLGGRDTASAIVRRWYARGREEAPRIARAAEAADERMGQAASSSMSSPSFEASFEASSNSPYGGPDRRIGAMDRRYQGSGETMRAA